MRTFIAGDGTDSTSRVNALLAAGSEFRFADLYAIGANEDPQTLWFTDWDGPLTWPVYSDRPFSPVVVERGGVRSEVGLKVQSIDVTWSPKLAPFISGTSFANPYLQAQNGFFDSRIFRLWRTVMPSPGDAYSLGACQYFGGRIAEIETSRGKIKFTVNCFLDVVNQKVPPNTIELSNTLAQYAGNVPVLVEGETAIPTFTVQDPSSTTIIMGDCIGPTAHKIYGTNNLRKGFMVFLPGSTLAGYWSVIGANANFNAGGGIHYNQIQVYSPFPEAPVVGDTFYISTQFPVDLATATAAGAAYFGFPYVPDPATAI
jgi:hypothetical protein